MSPTDRPRCKSCGGPGVVYAVGEIAYTHNPGCRSVAAVKANRTIRMQKTAHRWQRGGTWSRELRVNVCLECKLPVSHKVHYSWPHPFVPVGSSGAATWECVSCVEKWNAPIHRGPAAPPPIRRAIHCPTHNCPCAVGCVEPCASPPERPTARPSFKAIPLPTRERRPRILD